MYEPFSPGWLTQLKEMVVSANLYASSCHKSLLLSVVVLTIFGFGVWLDYRQITLSGSISAQREALNAIEATIAKDSSEVAFLKDEETKFFAGNATTVSHPGPPDPNALLLPSFTIITSGKDYGEIRLQAIIQRSLSVAERLSTYNSLKRDKEALLTDLQAKLDGITFMQSLMSKGRPALYLSLIVALVLSLIFACLWWNEVQRPFSRILKREAARR
jgi:cell division protein FtsB